MGSYMSSIRPQQFWHTMAPSSESETLSHTSASTTESELETPTPRGPIWEPQKTRAKTGGSYWVVDNDRDCVAFCQMQMRVSPSLRTLLIVDWEWGKLSLGLLNKEALQGLGRVHRSPSASNLFKGESNCIHPLQPLSRCFLSLQSQQRQKSIRDDETLERVYTLLEEHSQERQRQLLWCSVNFEAINSKRSKEPMSHHHVKETVLRIIIAANLHFAFTNNGEFQALVKHAYPDNTPPSRKSRREYLLSRTDGTKNNLKAKLAANESKVSLVLDVWTTRTNLSFLGTSPPLV